MAAALKNRPASQTTANGPATPGGQLSQRQASNRKAPSETTTHASQTTHALAARTDQIPATTASRTARNHSAHTPKDRAYPPRHSARTGKHEHRTKRRRSAPAQRAQQSQSPPATEPRGQSQTEQRPAAAEPASAHSTTTTARPSTRTRSARKNRPEGNWCQPTNAAASTHAHSREGHRKPSPPHGPGRQPQDQPTARTEHGSGTSDQNSDRKALTTNLRREKMTGRHERALQPERTDRHSKKHNPELSDEPDHARQGHAGRTHRNPTRDRPKHATRPRSPQPGHGTHRTPGKRQRPTERSTHRQTAENRPDHRQEQTNGNDSHKHSTQASRRSSTARKHHHRRHSNAPRHEHRNLRNEPRRTSEAKAHHGERTGTTQHDRPPQLLRGRARVSKKILFHPYKCGSADARRL
jgi:hypothetical protein